MPLSVLKTRKQIKLKLASRTSQIKYNYISCIKKKTFLMPTIRKDIKMETNCIDKSKISRVILKYINNKMAKTYELEFLLTGISLRKL